MFDTTLDPETRPVFLAALLSAAAFAPRGEEQRAALRELQRHVGPQRAGLLLDGLRETVRPEPADHLEAGRRERLVGPERRA